jgi:Na+/H+ antiporter NhaA
MVTSRVELRIFLTAAAIVDDIGAIVVVGAFYSGELHLGYVSCDLLHGSYLLHGSTFKLRTESDDL